MGRGVSVWSLALRRPPSAVGWTGRALRCSELGVRLSSLRPRSRVGRCAPALLLTHRSRRRPPTEAGLALRKRKIQVGEKSLLAPAVVSSRAQEIY